MIKKTQVNANREIRGAFGKEWTINVPRLPKLSDDLLPVSGSRCGALWGAINNWKSRYQLAKEMGGDKPEIRENVPMLIGRIMEKSVYEIGCAIFADTKAVFCDSTDPWRINAPALGLSGTPDALVMRGNELTLVEIKTTGEYRTWDSVPIGYVAQVQAYLLLTGLKRGELWCLHGGNNMQCYEFAAEKEWQKGLIGEIEKIHAELAAGHMPDPETPDDYRTAIMGMARAARQERVYSTDTTLAEICRQFIDRKNSASKEAADAKKELDGLRYLIAQRIGDAQVVEVSDGKGEVVISNKITQRKKYVVQAAEVSNFRVTIKKPKEKQ